MACSASSPMNHGEWTRPEFREINLSAEIGMYAENAGAPYDFEDQPTRPRELSPPEQTAPCE